VAWSRPRPAPRGDYTVAFVHIGVLLNDLMNGESFTDARDELIETLRGEEEEQRADVDALRERTAELDPESDAGQELIQQLNDRYERFRRWQQDAMRRRGALDAQQLETAYGEVVTAVDIVAEREGYDIVYRFIPPDEPFETANPDQAMLTIRLRTALRYPAETDITELVRDELGL
jgi:PAS domain-containing protein